jgi:hypothetical protein
MTPSSLTLRLLLVRVTATGDSPVVKHLRYRHEFLKSLYEEERRLCKEDPPCVIADVEYVSMAYSTCVRG